MTVKPLVEIIVRHLVDHPAEVVVTEYEGHRIIALELRVSPQDVGQVIGKRGRTIQALRTIVGSCSAKWNKRIVLQCLEEKTAYLDRDIAPRKSYMRN